MPLFVATALACLALGEVSSVAAQSLPSMAESQASSVSQAELFLTVGRYRDALREFQHIRDVDPTAPIVWLGIGRAEEALGHSAEAIQAYDAYTKRAAKDGGGFELLGRALATANRQSEALAAYRTAQRLDPTSKVASMGAANSLRSLNRREEALRLLRSVARAQPDEPTVWGTLAVVSLELGRDSAAASYWEEALRRDGAYFDQRADERTQWEHLLETLASRRPASEIAVSSGAAARSPDGDSGTTTAAKRDSTSVVNASPSYPRFARASRSAFVPGPSSSGSGFVVQREGGYVLTNKHVVRACGQVKVRVDGGKSRLATIRALDPDDDLALLQVPLPAGASATFRDDPAVRPGDDVVAVGFPLAGLLADQVNVSTGTVNALAGLYNDLHMLQMSAPVQPGSSGGALFDASGHVVGVVVTKLNARVVAEETGDIPQNVNFAVKTSVAREFLKQQGVAVRTATSGSVHSNADVGDIGRQVTLLVECWP